MKVLINNSGRRGGIRHYATQKDTRRTERWHKGRAETGEASRTLVLAIESVDAGYNVYRAG